MAFDAKCDAGEVRETSTITLRYAMHSYLNANSKHGILLRLPEGRYKRRCKEKSLFQGLFFVFWSKFLFYCGNVPG